MLKFDLEKKMVEGSADMFIVPNGTCTFRSLKENAEKDDFYMRHFNKYKEISELNNSELDLSDKPIQLWFVGEDDFRCENMQDHTSHITAEDGTKYTFRVTYGALPSKMINIKEGETVDVKFPITLTKGYNRNEPIPEEDETVNATLLLHLTANQLEYRYRRFGKFEETIDYVVA